MTDNMVEQRRKRKFEEISGFQEEPFSQNIFQYTSPTFAFNTPTRSQNQQFGGGKRRMVNLSRHESKRRRFNKSNFNSKFRHEYFPNPERMGLAKTEDYVEGEKKKREFFGKEKQFFSEEEVVKIVKDREKIIKKEYDQLLVRRMQEQFCEFNNFIRDHYQKKITNKECSYLS